LGIRERVGSAAVMAALLCFAPSMSSAEAGPPSIFDTAASPPLRASLREAPDREATLRSGVLTVRASYRVTATTSGAASYIPHLVVHLAGRKVIEQQGSPYPDMPHAIVQIAELDPDNAFPEVVFSEQTGGSHCCWKSRIISQYPNSARWVVIEAPFGTDPLGGAVDADGDGRYEFVVPDGDLFVRYGSPDASTAALKVFGLGSGQIQEISADPRFLPLHERWFAVLEGDIAHLASHPDGERNARLAGYVAAAYRVGRGEEAWQTMLRLHDPRQSGGPGFPDDLRTMLRNSGYIATGPAATRMLAPTDAVQPLPQ
jgi:hypothetical protein